MDCVSFYFYLLRLSKSENSDTIWFIGDDEINSLLTEVL